MILSPGVLEGAPHTHIAAVYAPAEAEAALERAVTDRFANVTAIRTREALAAVSGLLDRIAWAVRAAAAVTLAAGALVLAGAIAADRRRRTLRGRALQGAGRDPRPHRRHLPRRVRRARRWSRRPSPRPRHRRRLGGDRLADGFRLDLRWDIVAATVAICVALTLVVGFAGTWRILGPEGGALPAQRITQDKPGRASGGRRGICGPEARSARGRAAVRLP